MKILSVAAAMAALAISVSAHAADKPELRIGSVVAMTGPASALGLPEKNALELLQEQLANDTSLPFTVKFITYDDGSDPTKAVNNVRKLITEDRAHVVICCTTTPTSMAILETVTQAKVPNISLAQLCRSTSTSWNCALMSAATSSREMPNEPLAMPPKICASATLSASVPFRRLAPSAVRPSLVDPTVSLAADRRMSRSVVESAVRSNSWRFQSRAPEASHRNVLT